MANKKNKHPLLFVSLSIVLCVAMLLGTTWAWFTDSEMSLNNIIVSGNLDIELEYSKDTESWEPVTSTTKVLSDGLWEPGATEVVYFRLVNKGSLALKYHFGINIVSEVTSVNVEGKPFKLSDYIYFDVIDGVTSPYADRESAIAATDDATIIGTGYSKSGNMLTQNEEQYMALVVYMPTTVGNEANYKTGAKTPEIQLGINVFATQYVKEEDSFGNDYDKDALPCDIIATPETIDSILADAKPGTVIGLSDGKYGKITMTQNNLTLVSNTAVVDYINLNAKDDCKIIGITFDAAGAQLTYEMKNGKPVAQNTYANIVGAENSPNGADRAYIANCTFTGTPNNVDKYIPIAFYEKNRNTSRMQGLTVFECDFETSALYYIYTKYMGAGAPISITNNTFGDYDTKVSNAVYCGNGMSNITIAGNTFFNWVASAFTSSPHGPSTAPVVVTVKNNNFMQIAKLDSVIVINTHENYETNGSKGSSILFEENKANNGVDSFFGPFENDVFNSYSMNSSGSFRPAYDRDTLTSGGNLIVIQDIDLTGLPAVIDKSTTLLLNGYTISAEKNHVSGANLANHEISTLVVSGADTELVIEGDGTVVNTADNGAYALSIYDKAKVTIKGGNFISYYDALYVLDGELYIEGGFFQALENTTGTPDRLESDPPCHVSKVINCNNESYLNYKNGEFDKATAKVVATGGTFVNDDPSNLYKGVGGYNQSYLPAGYHVLPETQTNGDIWYTVIAD